jgi:rubrerythrin
MPTNENLKDAFAGESMANRKYTAFAKKADAEGFKQVARLFRAAAEAETVHAHTQLRLMGGLKSTAENLAVAIEGEGYEYTSMYPSFLAEAEKEGHKAAITAFKGTVAVEKTITTCIPPLLRRLKAERICRKSRSLSAMSAATRSMATRRTSAPVCGAGRNRFFEVK